ncbi:hypothetical protein ACFV6Y_39125 [Streptomyces massasporeus]|uniref:hypothetical protein n=1 Tax=Streptomyces massasporeus TaxID=67324 RepID=UPI0036618B35
MTSPSPKAEENRLVSTLQELQRSATEITVYSGDGYWPKGRVASIEDGWLTLRHEHKDYGRNVAVVRHIRLSSIKAIQEAEQRLPADAELYSSLPDASRVEIGQSLSEALAAWFHKRDELFEIRSGSTDGTSQPKDAVWAMDELVDIGDEIVAELAPDRAARCRITGEAE